MASWKHRSHQIENEDKDKATTMYKIIHWHAEKIELYNIIANKNQEIIKAWKTSINIHNYT